MRYGPWRPSLLALSAAALLLLARPAPAAAPADWRHDIDAMVGAIKATHPDPFGQVGRQSFERAAAALKTAVPRLSEEERAVAAMRVVASLGDAHTTLEPASPLYASWYPIRITQFADGYFITSAHQSVADLAGAQVLQVAGRPVGDVADEARTLLGAENAFWRKESLDPMLNAALMQGLHRAAPDGALQLRLKLRDGRVVERSLAPMRWAGRPFSIDLSSFDWIFARTEVSGPFVAPSEDFVSAYKGLRASAFRTYDPSRPPHLAQRSLSAHAIAGKDAYLIQVNLLLDTETETVPAFFARAFKEVDALKPRRLVLDLRYCPGGDGSSADRILAEILARRDRQPWKEFYVLTSGRTYSACLLLLGKLRAMTDVSLIGEPPGGGMGMFGDYSTFPLPRTGFELRVSAQRHDLGQSDDLRDVIPVDVPAPMSFADYAAGRDPALDPILQGVEMRSIVQVAWAEGGAAARDLYHQRKARFGGSSMWAPPAEPELRAVADRLLDAGRREDGRLVLELSSEIHPDEWRAWYNLGRAQLAAGLKDQAMESFRRCLALGDPTNFHADELSEMLVKAGADR